MPIDSNIYFQQQAPDIFGSISSGVEGALKMSDLIKQRKLQDQQLAEDQAIKDAYKGSVVSGADGSFAVDQKRLLSDLAKVNPQKAMEAERQFTQQSMEKEKQKFEINKRNTEALNSMVWGVNDQNSYKKFIENGSKLGLFNPNELPQQYDPNLVKRMQAASLSAKDQFDQQMKQKEFALKERELGLKKAELASKNGGAMLGLTEGEKAVDKDYAKDFNDFTGGGEAKAIAAIDKLKYYRDEMAKDNGLVQAGGGPISGSLPDAFRTQKSISQRDNIVTVANSALKATFGGQLSDGERKAAANEFYNDKLDNSENLKIIDRKIQELEEGLVAQKNKANYYTQNRSLKGLGRSTPVESKFEADVLNYARAHKITPEQALSIKQQRTGGK